jgi:hypothetical protein
MFDDVLTPTHSSFIGSFSEFEAQFKGPIAQLDCWKSGPPFDPDSKYAQLLAAFPTIFGSISTRTRVARRFSTATMREA